jgi:hypothetical protein
MKRTGRDEPVGVVIHICMETAQGNSPSSYLYLKLTKMPCFSFYLLCFFFYKIREQEGRTCSAQGEGGRLAPVGGGGNGEKGRRMNTVQITYTHVCKCKNDTCQNCSRNQGSGDEREQWRG